MDLEKEKMSLNPENKNIDSVEEQVTAPDTENKVDKSEEKFESTIFQKHVYNTKKPTNNGSKKRIVVAVVSVVLCIALGVGAFTLPKILGDDTDATSSTQSTVDESTITVLKKADILKDAEIEIDGKKALVDTNIKSVYFANGYEEFTVRSEFAKKQETKNTASSNASSTSSVTSSGTSSTAKKQYDYETVWSVDGIEKRKTVSDAILDKIEDCLNIKAIREMKNNFNSVDEYHKHYGMTEKLTAGVVIEFNDGTEKLTISVGAALATYDSYYFMTSLSDTVYVVDADYADHFFCSTKEFADPTIIPKLEKTKANEGYFNTNGQLARFDKIKIYGDVFGDKVYEFKMSTGVSADYMPYQMTAPYNRPASDAFLAAVLAFAEKGLDASVLYSYKVTDKDIKECGLEKPKGFVELVIGDYKFKLTIGGARNDGTESLAAMVEGNDMVFGIDQQDLAFIINASNNETVMFNSNFILEEIYKIKSYDIKIGSKTYSFDLKHTPRASDSKVMDTEVKLGNTVMNPDYFKRIYGRVLMLTLVEFVTEAEKTEPVLTTTFHFIGDSKPRVVEFTATPDDIYHYTAWVDGTPLGEVLKSSVDDILDCVQLYLDGKEVPDTW